MSDFQFKTYRCEWVAEVYSVDQYGQRQRESPFYEKAWPTRDEAVVDLMFVTVPDPHVADRRRYPKAPHSYYECGVRYREVNVDVQ